MANTSNILAAGKALLAGLRSTGTMGRAAAALATAALGLSLLAGAAAPPVARAPQPMIDPPQVISDRYPYRVSIPNERAADTSGAAGSAPRPADASTSAQFRWAATEGTAPDTALKLPELWLIYA